MTERTAAVVGASVTGLLVARALTPFFTRVTIVERDRLPDAPLRRKGVPQGAHSHMLLERGARAVFRLFPEAAADPEGFGLRPRDLGGDFRWFHFGVWKKRFPSGIRTYLCDRVVFEHALRRAVLALPNVRLLDGTSVSAWRKGPGPRVEGLVLGGPADAELGADLVVDAAGRGSKVPDWLRGLGCEDPACEEIEVNVGYSSRLYRLPAELAGRLPLTVSPHPPRTRRMGIMYALDEERMMVTLGGWLGDYPPVEEQGFLEFAASLEVEEFRRNLSLAEPIGEIAGYRFRSNRRRRFRRLASWPGGLLVAGDSACSFNPVYGQGMTVSALEAELIERTLERATRRGREPGDPRVTRDLQRRLGKVVSIPWMLATSEDLRFPEARGKRGPWLAFLHWYMARVHALSASDAAVLKRFLEVMSFLRPPQAMFHPAVAGKVLLWGRPAV